MIDLNKPVSIFGKPATPTGPVEECKWPSGGKKRRYTVPMEVTVYDYGHVHVQTINHTDGPRNV